MNLLGIIVETVFDMLVLTAFIVAVFVLTLALLWTMAQGGIS